MAVTCWLASVKWQLPRKTLFDRRYIFFHVQKAVTWCWRHLGNNATLKCTIVTLAIRFVIHLLLQKHRKQRRQAAVTNFKMTLAGNWSFPLKSKFKARSRCQPKKKAGQPKMYNPLFESHYENFIHAVCINWDVSWTVQSMMAGS